LDDAVNGQYTVLLSGIVPKKLSDTSDFLLNRTSVS
jgi:hypothetical protein